MNRKNKMLAMVSATVLGIGLAIPVLAQDTSTSAPVPASTSMHRAGADTEGAAKNAYIGTATALDDTKITTEVKAAFASGKDIESNHIHVTTTAGVVTLHGRVPNSDMSARAEAIAGNTSGVRGVTNDLRVRSSASQN
ncbi:MAG TPA: BON domain-containing protein [Candidatus Binataceae bacterium]|nr:BON domain-containing protein [Candidatus Binataceae bacterium]